MGTRFMGLMDGRGVGGQRENGKGKKKYKLEVTGYAAHAVPGD